MVPLRSSRVLIPFLLAALQAAARARIDLLQAAIVDPAQPKGFAFTNAIELEILP